MEEKDVKPIPKYIINQIKNKDKRTDCNLRFYSYLTTIKKELVKITVACRNYEKQWFCKQVAIHTIGQKCYVKDLNYSLFGFTVNWYDQNISSSQHNHDTKWCEAGSKYFDPYAPIVNKSYVLKFEKYKYSVANKYPYSDLFKYLKIYEEFPEVEYLMKLGLFHLATRKAIILKLKKDKMFRKWISKNATFLKNDYGTYPYFSSTNILNAYKRKISLFDAVSQDKEIKNLQDQYCYRNHINKVIKKSEILNFIEYLKKQETNLRSYEDYLTACEYLELDMTLPKNKFPHDFKKWHDMRIDQYHTAKALKDEQERKELYKQFSEVAKKYLPLQRELNDDYVAIIAKSPKDLIAEGKTLNHCVGRMNYDQKFVREESLIFFIRNRENPNTPFVTVEYSLKNHKVLQCYGYNDSRPQADVLEFVNNKWLPYANRKLRKIA